MMTPTSDAGDVMNSAVALNRMELTNQWGVDRGHHETGALFLKYRRTQALPLHLNLTLSLSL